MGELSQPRNLSSNHPAGKRYSTNSRDLLIDAATQPEDYPRLEDRSGRAWVDPGRPELCEFDIAVLPSS